jgi:hypothetical protein
MLYRNKYYKLLDKPSPIMPDVPETSKDRGHLAELIFAVGARRRDHIVCTPGGDNAPFDVVLFNAGGRFIRVQIKSCLKREEGRDRHTWTVKKGGPKKARAYGKQDVDVMALYAYDEDAWWFIPIEALGLEPHIKIDESSPFCQYKNCWDVFK